MAGLLKKILKSDKLILLATGLCLSLLMCVLYVIQPSMLNFLNYKIYDQQLRRHHSTKHSGVPVIVDIDEKSLAAMGQWPWPRYRMALLLEKIRLAGALAVGLDMVLAEPDRTSPARLRTQLKRELKVEVEFSGLPKALEDNDAVLANVLRGKPYVLGFYFSFSRDELATLPRMDDELLKPAKATIASAPDALPAQEALHTARGTVPPLAMLAEAASATGFFNTAPDQDGILRRTPLFIHYQGNIHPSLAMATLMQATGDDNVVLRLASQGVDSLRYAGTVIPVDRHAQLLVNYHGPQGGFPYLSASDILEDRVNASELEGKIVFIGTSAAGLKDLRATPFSAVAPGVEVHAAVVDNILTQDFISVPDYAPALELTALLASGLAITLLATWARATWIVLPLLGMGAGLWWGTGYLLGTFRVFVSPLYAYLILGTNFGLLTLMKFWREERQRQFIHGAFSHYLAPAIINQIMESPESLSLQGQEKEITIMFSDVRGFTSMSEKLTPTQVTDLLHDYLTPMTRVITEHMGTLDKFIGDAIMAFWNAPLDVPGHQVKAVASALQMFEHLESLNEGFHQKYGLTINIGVGLHCGKVHVGNMGSAELFDYTLIGDNVNLTSRLEGLTKYYGQRLLLTEDMVAACGDAYVYLEMDCVRVKGKLKPIPIYTAMTHAQAKEREGEIELHRGALALYRERRFAEARAGFRELLRTTGNHTLYAMYLERCDTLEQAPPPTDWDCVYTHTSK